MGGWVVVDGGREKGREGGKGGRGEEGFRCELKLSEAG